MTETLESASAPALLPFNESDAATPAAALRQRMEEDGYLFFRRLVPAEEILTVRRAALELCSEAGWLAPGTEFMDGIANKDNPPLMEGHPDYMVMYRKLLRTPSFHDFPAQPALMQTAGKILDLPTNEVMVHPRRIGRVTFPGYERATTPAHQDHFYIRGSVETYSCWIPLGQCPIELGGLAVSPGSHKTGFRDHTVEVAGAVGGRAVPINESKTIWHTADFGLGDVLFFHSFTVHKALPNKTPNRLRISTDNRYQRPKEAIDPSSLVPHFATAEEIAKVAKN